MVAQSMSIMDMVLGLIDNISFIGISQFQNRHESPRVEGNARKPILGGASVSRLREIP